MFNWVLLGPPGAGKGTQALYISSRFKVPHISTGDMFRRAIAKATLLGKEAQGYMDKGFLVPDDVVIGLVKERLAEPDCKNGFVLDGFPRTIFQAEALDSYLEASTAPLQGVLCFNVELKELLRRISGRRVCPKCESLYHVDHLKGNEICIKDGAVLFQRSDDQESAVKIRLERFKEQTQPLKDYYLKQGKLTEINGLGLSEEVSHRIESILSVY